MRALGVHDPYFQYFTGEEFFQHEFPHERSDLSHWRKRLGDKLELLAESLRVAHQSGALRTKNLARVTVDTTVQPKNITFPTDAKLLHAAITHDGRKYRMLNVIDEFTHECLAIRIARKLKAIDVIDVTSDLFILRGVPGHIRSDNGPEFVAKAVQEWITAVGAKTAYITPGSP